MKIKQRKVNLARSITLAWASLESHLGDTVRERKAKVVSNSTFHSRCCREYAEIIFALATELEHLNRRKRAIPKLKTNPKKTMSEKPQISGN